MLLVFKLESRSVVICFEKKFVAVKNDLFVNYFQHGLELEESIKVKIVAAQCEYLKVVNPKIYFLRIRSFLRFLFSSILL